MAVNDQPGLFDPPSTRRAAHEQIQPVAGTLRSMVYMEIQKRGDAGLTCDDVEFILGMSHQTASARVNELKNARMIVDTGIRRATRTGRKAVAWVASR